MLSSSIDFVEFDFCICTIGIGVLLVHCFLCCYYVCSENFSSLLFLCLASSLSMLQADVQVLEFDCALLNGNWCSCTLLLPVALLLLQ